LKSETSPLVRRARPGHVWFIDRPSRNDLHPTMKPVDLVERAIRNSSPRGGLVLDPFGGSGTRLIAQERTGRKAALLELDPRYVDVIVERWQDETGREATLEGDGCSFAAFGTERLGAEAEPVIVAPKRQRKIGGRVKTWLGIS
jgi:hypothetical protein